MKQNTRTAWRVLFFATAAFAAIAQGAPDSNREAKKRAFLARPAFSVNKNVPPAPVDGPPAAAPTTTKATSAPAAKAAAGNSDHCGKHPYLGNYCFRPTANNDWAVCADKWGGCLTSVTGKSK